MASRSLHSPLLARTLRGTLLGLVVGLGSVLGGTVSAGAATVVEDGVVTRIDAKPKRLSGIDVKERLDENVPGDISFTDSFGSKKLLEEVVDSRIPTIFTLNYSNCPMLCSLQLTGLTKALGQLELTLGEDYRVVTASVDPRESPARAQETRQRYLSDLGSGEEESKGWRFLTGSKESIDALAASLGVSYGYNEARKEYVHPAVAVIATPELRISRYLYGVEYHPRTLALSLIEAAAGKIGSSIDRFILYCFHFDEAEGRYAPVAMNIMRAGGGLTVVALGAFLGAFWLRQWRRNGSSVEIATS